MAGVAATSKSIWFKVRREVARLWGQWPPARVADERGWRADDRFRARRYATYEEYLAHQAAKLAHLDLAEYDEQFRAALRARVRGLALLSAGSSVLCLAARLGSECKAFGDLGCFAVGLDLNPGPNNRFVVHGDFHHLQFADASVDCVYTNALDHSFDLPRVVGEARRVLKPGGFFLAEIVAGSRDAQGRGPGRFESLWWDHADDVIAALVAGGFERRAARDFDFPWNGRLVALRRGAT